MSTEDTRPTPPGRLHKLLEWAYILALCIGAALIGGGGYVKLRPTWDTWFRFEPGARCFIRSSQLALSDSGSEKPLQEALAVGDHLGIEQLIREGRAVRTGAGTPALVLRSTIARRWYLVACLLGSAYEDAPWVKRQVRILAGPDRGKLAWLNDSQLLTPAQHFKSVLDTDRHRWQDGGGTW